MTFLSEVHHSIFKEFCNGKLTIQKTRRMFSSMAIDQAHEQTNAAVNGYCRAVGLTQNPDFRRCWTVAGPELARIISEFEEAKESSHKADLNTHHYEQTKGFQSNCSQQVKSLVEVMEDMGNPFTDDSTVKTV